ncbi:galactose mutarotase [Robbsia sp. Bb-Pol-6]|uniref:Aldose 1-epimerase n=1 Tax=Robbsia betulipollinis TaxID=2981849 RepID=A0ABT3ZJ42_9BURK|nr:aldose epimerase family protein [Robbsia betulipollinis]MCY0386340.1 galactose mutarotase [Robbsia betulipollinis]
MHAHITVRCDPWGQLPTGEAVERYTLTAPNGVEVAISTLGATLLHWLAPDREGRLANILLGFETPADYLASDTHMGGLIGRWGNRIADARFTLDTRVYELEANDGVNSLHGGVRGFDRAVWRAERLDDGVRMHHVSPDGDAGFPGRLTVRVDFRLDVTGALRLDYHAQCDAPTPINLTSHPYFNLAATGTALDHVVRIAADRILATDATGIPVALRDVMDTAFDFRRGANVRAQLEINDAATRAIHGIDHCFVLGAATDRYVPLREVASAFEPVSGRELTVSTTERGLQFYTASNLEGVDGKGGLRHRAFDAICFEAQAWPNQINGMPDGAGVDTRGGSAASDSSRAAEAVTLRPGDTYRQTTVYRTSVR